MSRRHWLFSLALIPVTAAITYGVLASMWPRADDAPRPQSVAITPTSAPPAIKRHVRQPVADTPKAKQFSPGDRCILRNGESASLLVDSRAWVTTDHFAHLEMVKGLKANDTVGLEKMAADGTLLRLPGGTEALIIAPHDDFLIHNSGRFYEVRIVGGQHDGRKCYVHHELVHPKPK
jgi:hypothetical protein